MKKKVQIFFFDKIAYFYNLKKVKHLFNTESNLFISLVFSILIDRQELVQGFVKR